MDIFTDVNLKEAAHLTFYGSRTGHSSSPAYYEIFGHCNDGNRQGYGVGKVINNTWVVVAENITCTDKFEWKWTWFEDGNRKDETRQKNHRYLYKNTLNSAYSVIITTLDRSNSVDGNCLLMITNFIHSESL